MACLQYPLVSRNRGFGKGSGIHILAVGSCPINEQTHITTSGIFHRIRDILKDNARVLGNSCFHQLPMPRCTLMSCQGRTYASSNRGSGCAHCVAYAIILCYPVNRTQFRSLMILIHTFDVTWLITRRTSSV